MSRRQVERPRLELIEGGLSREEDWRVFCERIGWQEPEPTALGEDFEAQLSLRVFGSLDSSVIVLATHRSAPPASHPRAGVERTSQARWGALIACAVAVVVLGVMALTRAGAGESPAARPLPNPVPEWELRAQPDEAPEAQPDQAPSPPPDAAPDPGGRHARAEPAVAPPRGLQRGPGGEEPSAQVAGRPAEGPVRTAAFDPAASRVGVKAISPDPEPSIGTRIETSLPPRLQLPVGSAVLAEGRAGGEDARESLPTWGHLTGASGWGADDRQAMAVVDVIEAGRKLRSAL